MGPAGLLMFEGHDQAIHDLLAAQRLAEPAALDAALAEPRGPGQTLADVVIAKGLVARRVLLQAVAVHTGSSYHAELPAALPGVTLALVEGRVARHYGVAPLAADHSLVSLAVTDPFDVRLADELGFVLERSVRIAVADPERVRLLIRKHYGDEMPVAAGEPDSNHEDIATELTVNDIEQMAGQTPIIRFVNAVLARAIREKASDVHFEPFEREFKIRYRVDGTLYEIPPPVRRIALPVISRLKVLAHLNIAERRLPQDGRIRLTIDGRNVDLRISTLPTQFGESVVLRVLDQSSVRLELAQLGLPVTMQSALAAAIRQPNGMVIVTGPTGSGKTTTLYSCLQALNTADAKLLTVEDPVEYEIEGVMQVPVNLPAGLTFARALRTFLRQDPDIVMVGEIRDSETARIAIQASLTGHLVLSTLHTNDAPSAMTRLVDMGIEPFLLASTVEAVLAQRLVRRVCSSCRTAYQPDEALLRQLGVAPAVLQGRPFYAAAGCADCQQTGYRGRLGIFEYLPMTDALRELVVQGASLVQLREQAVEEGMVPLRTAGFQAILAGETTFEEVIKYI